jgi:hypothetical protein
MTKFIVANDNLHLILFCLPIGLKENIMRKIILAFDGIHFSDSTFKFAAQLNLNEPILLTGVFLPQASYANLWAYADGTGVPVFVPQLEDDDEALIEKNIEIFQQLCVKEGIEYRVHKDFYDLALPELKKESRFADLMIIAAQQFYEPNGSDTPNRLLIDALMQMECSVLVVPEKYDFPGVNIIAYDGSDASVFAIKQFAYLLPELSANPTLLTYMNPNESESIPFEPYIEELAARHFSNLTISKIDMDAKKYFSTWVSEKKSALVISGSFGRTSFSQLLKKSFIADVIRKHLLPVFIGHK